MARLPWVCHVGHCMYDPCDAQHIWILSDIKCDDGKQLCYTVTDYGEGLYVCDVEYIDMEVVQYQNAGYRVPARDTEKFDLTLTYPKKYRTWK